MAGRTLVLSIFDNEAAADHPSRGDARVVRGTAPGAATSWVRRLAGDKRRVLRAGVRHVAEPEAAGRRSATDRDGNASSVSKPNARISREPITAIVDPLTSRRAREDQQADQQAHRRAGIPRLVQRKQIVKNDQHRRDQQAAQHRPDDEPPSPGRRQVPVRLIGHVRPAKPSEGREAGKPAAAPG